MDFLEQLCLSDASRLSTQRVRFVWIVRHIDPQLEASVAELLRRYSTLLRDAGVNIDSELYVTCSHSELRPDLTQFDQFAHLRPRLPRYGSGDRTLTIRNPDEIYDEWEEEERQWAEMEALEELKMQELDPFVDAYEVGSSCSKDDNAAATYEGEGYASSETSTLLEVPRDGDEVRQSNNFSDVRLTLDESATLNRERPLPSPLRTPLLPLESSKKKKKTCQCALIQYQRQKLQKSTKPYFNSASYGARPDINHLILSAANSDQHTKSMIAVCANSEVSRQANKAVSKAKLAFARGQRATDVEIFAESFS
ncbi:ferric-chelate reductase Frp1 [Neodidymelliopsis sp. IMI 364377]|nr:ferric-chelate reductase Frp1 [Neodidymelliopsis sp. IMI 364377]